MNVFSFQNLDGRRRQGFTLFELLVVIAIFSVLTGIGTTVFFRMTSLSQRLKIHQELGRAADGFFVQVQDDIDRLLPASLAGQTVQSATHEAPESFYHNADDTLRLMVSGKGPAGELLPPQQVTYRVDRADQTLLRVVGDESAVVSSKVIPNAATVRLRFEFAGEENGQWRLGWSSQEPPRAVRASVVVAHRSQPDIQIARKMTFAVHPR